jgi:hypothetical protein
MLSHYGRARPRRRVPVAAITAIDLEARCGFRQIRPGLARRVASARKSSNLLPRSAQNPDSRSDRCGRIRKVIVLSKARPNFPVVAAERRDLVTARS